MFHHGLYGNGSSISGETLRLLKTRIRTSNTLNELLKKEIKKAKSKNKNSFTIERTGKKSLEFTARKDKDLYYSLQKKIKKGGIYLCICGIHMILLILVEP